MQEEILERYATLKTVIKKYEAEADEIKKEIEASMLSLGLEEVEFNLGKVSIQSKKTYSYPDEIVTAEETLKAKKKEAVQLGTAVEVPGKPFVVFYSNEE